MEKKNLKKPTVRLTVQGWRIGDYIRQLSVVIIGIVVTFYGGSLIEQAKTRREIRQSMQLLHDELKSNLKQLDDIREYVARDHSALDSFVENYIDQAETTPADSVKKYFVSLSRSRTFNCSVNALEALKNSSGMQQIEDRTVVIGIFDCYDNMEQLFHRTNSLYDLKSEAVLSFYHSLDKLAVKRLFEEQNPYLTLRAMAANREMYNYTRNTTGQLKALLPLCDQTLAKVQQTITMLKNEYRINE